MNDKSLIRLNAETDVHYAPFCMRCDSMHRMLLVARFYWRCGNCGAEHDERTLDEYAGRAAP